MNPASKVAVLALDFDGVLCESEREALLVAWCGWHTQYGRVGTDMPEVPESFAHHFSWCRQFARSLDHFVVAFAGPGESGFEIVTQNDFDAAFATIDPAVVDAFTEAALRARAWLRIEHRAAWLALQHLYPAVVATVAQLGAAVHVVTAREPASVRDLMGEKAPQVPLAGVWGRETTKMAALEMIAGLEGIAPEEMLFVDDNITNVIDAADAGFPAWWATWGWRAPDHTVLAQRHQVTAVSQAGFAGLLRTGRTRPA